MRSLSIMRFSVASLLICSVAESVRRAQEISVALARAPAYAHAERTRLHTFRVCTLRAIDPESAHRAAESAWAEAQRAGVDTAIAWGLLARHVLPTSESRDERLANCREALQIARKSHDRDLVAGAHLLLLAELAEHGELTELDRLLSPGGALLSTAPWLEAEDATAWFLSLRSTVDGQVGRAEAIAQTGLTTLHGGGDPARRGLWLAQLVVIRWMQARTGEVESIALRGRQECSNEVLWTVLLAWAWAQQGRRTAARAMLETVPRVSDLARDRDWLATVSVIALTSAELGLTDTARSLYAELLPARERLITTNFGTSCLGTVQLPLARLSALLGDPERAVDHYRDAIASTAAMGAHPWLAEAQIGLAALLLERAGPDSIDEAQALATEAAAAGRSLRLHRFEDAGATLLASIRRHRERAGRSGDQARPPGP